MSDLAAPTAKRLQRPSWKDHRLLLGVILVLVAGTLGARLVASADDRTPYYVAAVNLVAGERVTADSFKRADVALADGVGRYVSADAPVPDGKVLLRDIRAGELVPASALGAPGTVDLQRVTVRADAVSTAGLQRGHRVDVYVTPDTAHRAVGDEKPPQTSRLLSEVAVVDVLPVEGGFGAAAMTSVQLHVPADRVRTVVEAVDQGAKLTLVPVTGPRTGAETHD
ncbi:SAF domain-containing protein [Intrasporangium sp.]|uniref:SAF domain-containing protein n=1 Tax=Intrasporangium sp. TaxID=1925024 RepID=UPI00293A1470|nr:SAF domain-containing protein [Intrasporangium sp.]MDV3220047.1 SAF domain-containing protein [Intrasporangium sp.]